MLGPWVRVPAGSQKALIGSVPFFMAFMYILTFGIDRQDLSGSGVKKSRLLKEAALSTRHDLTTGTSGSRGALFLILGTSLIIAIVGIAILRVAIFGITFVRFAFYFGFLPGLFLSTAI